MFATTDSQSLAYMPVPTLARNDAEQNWKTLPSGNLEFPKISLASLKRSESDASSIRTLFLIIFINLEKVTYSSCPIAYFPSDGNLPLTSILLSTSFHPLYPYFLQPYPPFCFSPFIPAYVHTTKCPHGSLFPSYLSSSSSLQNLTFCLLLFPFSYFNYLSPVFIYPFYLVYHFLRPFPLTILNFLYIYIIIPYFLLFAQLSFWSLILQLLSFLSIPLNCFILQLQKIVNLIRRHVAFIESH